MRTDMAKVIVAFRNFVNAPKNNVRYNCPTFSCVAPHGCVDCDVMFPNSVHEEV